MSQRRTITRATLNQAAVLIRRANPNGLSVGELASLLNVNPSTLRTGGYVDQLLREHPDLYRDRGRIYNDGEKTGLLLSMRAAQASGETAWALELRARWDELRAVPRGQTTLDLEDEPC